MYFNFNEINILLQNLRTVELKEFLTVLKNLEENTKEEVLLTSIHSLRDKLLELSDTQFMSLYQDIQSGIISTTDGYQI